MPLVTVCPEDKRMMMAVTAMTTMRLTTIIIMVDLCDLAVSKRMFSPMYIL